jgi:hypothetical protein
MVEFARAPSYPTPDFGALGQAIGNIPANMRRAQADELALQEAQMQLQQQQALQGAFAGGLPMANGQPDYAQIMQKLAQAGDTASIARLAPALLEQQQLTQAAAPSPLFGGAAVPGAAQPPVGDAVSQLEAGIAKVETGGEKHPYHALGRTTASGDRAYGKYQVMGANIPAWTQEVLGRKMTPREFLDDPDAQEAVARAKLGGYLAKYGDAPDAASMWFTGKPLAEGANRRDINNMSGARYAELATGVRSDATPTAPPVSASAGSAIPRSGGDTGGAAGIGVRGGAPGSVASLVSAAVPDPNKSATISANLAKLVGAPDANAPLNPAQAERAQRIIAARYGGGAAPQATQVAQAVGAGAPITPTPQRLRPQVALPGGFKPGQEEQAITAINNEIRRLSPNPAARDIIRDLEHQRDRIEQSLEPVDIGGERYAATGEQLTHRVTAGERTLQEKKDEAKEIAEGIKKGTIPPTMTGLYGLGGLVRSELAKSGDYNLSKANLEYDAAKKQIMSLNGPQMIRFNALAESVVNTIERTVETSKELKLSGIPLANKVELAAWMQTNGNSPKGQLVAKYITDVNTLKEEYANLANGGYAPTESAWKLSNMVINGDYGSKQFEASLDEAQRLINFRRAAFSDLSTMGPGAPNPYMPGRGAGGVPQSVGERVPPQAGRAAPIAVGTELAPGFVYKGTR